MSVEFHPASGPGGNNASLQGTTVGGSKPLHRFLKVQPKIVGVLVVALGLSFFIVAISVSFNSTFHDISTDVSPSSVTGTLFIVSGILFILTEHKLTKKIVSLSLALSIVTILGALWSMFHMIITFSGPDHYRYYGFFEVNTAETEDTEWLSYSESMGLCLEVLFLFYTSVGIVFFITMSVFAGAALRSTRSQVIVMMTTMPTQTPAE
ncbi:membrane-spanning 4-domains subfamily A member 6B-like isoform X1 [Channa argus]|uniref:membrane-spanning 4-domains subfamily A member 6B-like isoform X1 n=1 Tax=Channa argus TaxID=215402 RepID=UPI003522CCE3